MRQRQWIGPLVVCVIVGILVGMLFWARPFSPSDGDAQGFLLSYATGDQMVSHQEMRKGEDLALDWGNYSPKEGVLKQDGTRALVEARLLIERDGTYGFYVEARDGCQFTLDGMEYFADPGVGVHKSDLIEVELEAGFHALTLSAYDETTTFLMELHMASTGEDIPVDLSQLPLVPAELLYLPETVADKIVLSGQVTDGATGANLPGAVVTFPCEDGSVTGQTAMDGSFSLLAPKGTYGEMTVSLAGYDLCTAQVGEVSASMNVAVQLTAAETDLTLIQPQSDNNNYQLAENVPQWTTTDLNFTIPVPQGSNPYMDTTGKVVGQFTDGERVIEVPAFYRGDGTFTLRFTPTTVGQWDYTVTYDRENTLYYDLKEPMTDESAPYNDYYAQAFAPWSGTVLAVENSDPDAHGGITVDPENPYHYLYEDGTTYFQMGYEVDWLGVLAQSDMEGAKALVDMAAQAGFTTIMMNVFAWDTTWCPGNDLSQTFPSAQGYDFGPSDSIPWYFLGDEVNEETYLTENIDFSLLNETYWQNYDEIVQYMNDKGITPHLLWKVYNKQALWPGGQSDDSTINDLFITPEDTMYARYFVSRYQGYNVVFDLGKGYGKFDVNVMDYNIPEGEGAYFYLDNTLREWRDLDGYDRLKTIHDADYRDDPASTARYNGYLKAGLGSAENGSLTDMVQIVSDQEWGRATSSNWYEEIYSAAMVKKALFGMPYYNIEPGAYQWGNGDHLATFTNGQQSPEECLRNITEVYMAGSYAMYYYTYHAWDVVKYTETPEKLYYYTNLANFLQVDVGLENWRNMTSDDSVIGNDIPADYLDYDVVGRHAMYIEGQEYLVFLGWYLGEGEEIHAVTAEANLDSYRPEGDLRNVTLEITNIAEGGLTAQWYNIQTGERIDAGEITENGSYTFEYPQFEATPDVAYGQAENVFLHLTAK